MKKKEFKMRFEVLFQIVLLIGTTFSISYFLDESTPEELTSKAEVNKKQSLIDVLPLFLRIIGKFIFSEKGFVSALGAEDIVNGVYTCLESNEGKICREFPASECAQKCKGSCIPTTAEETAQCKLGTCYNPINGFCSTLAPKEKCESTGGKWYDDPNGNINVCKRGCCFIAGKTEFDTEQECAYKALVSGVDKNFKPEINTDDSSRKKQG